MILGMKYDFELLHVEFIMHVVRHAKVCEGVRSVGRRVKPTVRPWKFATHKNTRDLVKTSEYRILSNGF